MEQPRDLRNFDVTSHGRKAWRVAHLTDIHAVGERYGFRIESGRAAMIVFAHAIIFHGHRHMDWIGTCGLLKVVSGPSPVMGALDSASTHFYIHTLTTNSYGHTSLLPPERVNITGSASD
jgi:hypothetical protein